MPVDLQMSEFGANISKLRKQYGLSRVAFAEALGVKADKIKHVETGHQRADHELMGALISVYNVNLNDLFSGDSSGQIVPAASEFVQISKFTVSASAGNGARNDTEDSAGHYAFSRRWIKRRGLNPDSLAVIMVTGDSMEPKLRDNDLILLDRDQTEVRDGKTYVVRLGNELVVKNIQHLGHNQITLLSANTFYPPRTIDLPEGDSGTIQIIGRVVASMHEW